MRASSGVIERERGGGAAERLDRFNAVSRFEDGCG